MPDRSSTSTPIASPKDASSAQLVQWTFDRINAQDVDSLRKFSTARSTVHFPTGTCHGSAEIVAYFNWVFAAVTDFAFELISIAESGNDVLVHWHLTGRHVGIFVGASSLPDGESTSRDSTTSSSSPSRCATRQVEFARQIKLLPTDGSIADRAMNGVFNAKRV